MQGIQGPAGTIDVVQNIPQSGATDGQAIVWSLANTQWEPGTVSGGSGSTTFEALTDTDVDLSAGTEGQVPFLNDSSQLALGDINVVVTQTMDTVTVTVTVE